MNKLKKVTILLLMFCFALSLGSVKAYAASGTIFFTDLETAVGETITITGSVVSHGDNLEDIELHMSYDPTYVRFVSGDGVSEDSEGQLVYTGTGESERLDFEMEFQAIEQGSMRMNLDQATVYTVNDEQLDCELGYADITIGEGDPSKIEPTTAPGVPVTVEDVSYELSEAFNDGELPQGFVRGTIDYQGQSYEGAVQENGEMRLAYLISEAETGAFFIYEDDQFTPFEQVIISETSYIILLPDDGSVKLPSNYEKVNLTMNGHDFTAWQDVSDDEYYLLYAMNSSGEMYMYRYDSVEETYQRFDVPETNEEAETEGASGLIGRFVDYMRNHIEQFLLGAALITLLFIVLVIIIGVKLRHRNLELDELYDEYDIDGEGSAVEKPMTKTSNRQLFARETEDDYDDEDDDLDEEDEDNFEVYSDEDDNLYEEDFIVYDEDDDDLSDLEESLGRQPEKQAAKQPSKKRPEKQTESFEIEFIDLD